MFTADELIQLLSLDKGNFENWYSRKLIPQGEQAKTGRRVRLFSYPEARTIAVLGHLNRFGLKPAVAKVIAKAIAAGRLESQYNKLVGRKTGQFLLVAAAPEEGAYGRVGDYTAILSTEEKLPASLKKLRAKTELPVLVLVDMQAIDASLRTVDEAAKARGEQTEG